VIRIARALAQALVVVCLCPSRAPAQSADPAGDRDSASAARPQSANLSLADNAPFASVYGAPLVRDLPTGGSLFGLIESVQPSVVSDRFSSGGLYAGQPARLGGLLASWTRTQFAIDGVSISDPNLTGTPLLVPGLFEWSTITVTHTGAPSAVRVRLQPVMPGDRWTSTIEAAASHAGLAGSAPTTAASGAPAIAALAGFDRASLTAGGPLVPGKLGLFMAGAFTRGSQYDRAVVPALESSSASAFSHLVFTPDAESSLRVVGWVQRNRFPMTPRLHVAQAAPPIADTGGHVQAVWDRRPSSGAFFRVAASYSGRRRVPNLDPTSTLSLDRLTDGPVSQFSTMARSTTRQWSLHGTLGRQSSAPRLLKTVAATADVTGGGVESSSFFSGVITEVLNAPARIWAFHPPAPRSLRRNLAIALTGTAELQPIDQLSLRAALKLESETGAADGASSDVAWRRLLPEVRATWTIPSRWQVEAFAAYSRSMQPLALDYLAVGDPGASTASVYRWDRTVPGFYGPLVARVGPGTGGAAPLAGIDPSLAPPTSNDVVLGLQVKPRERLLFRFAALARREVDLLSFVNLGAPASTAYTMFTVRDPGADVLSAEDDQLLPVFNRLPGSFGRDRYLLTNAGADTATFKGIELSIEASAGAMTLIAGATAGEAVAPAAAVGYGPLENDETVLGELDADPNARTLARGRPFTDRAYTGKIAAVFGLPAGIRAGVIARYQDGQPFARVLVFPILDQGAQAVRAFANGDSRFMFIGTLDARLQKDIPFGAARLDVYLDAYNLLNLSNSVEEDVTAPPDVRIATALQPPRSFHVGLRLRF
jgi:hypothetical protein